METDKIRELADKYYEGLTSEEEEAQLRQYLSDPSLPASLKAEYGYLTDHAPAIPDPSDDFYERLDALTRTETGFDSLTGARTALGPLPRTNTGLDSLPRTSTALAGGSRLARYSFRIAAAVAVLFATYFLADYIGNSRMKDTYSDPQIAMAEVKSVLALVSENLNAGTKELKPVSTLRKAPEAMEEVGRMNTVIEENLGKLRYLNLLDIIKEN